MEDIVNVDFQGKSFEVMRVIEPDLVVVSLAGAVQGLAETLNGALVASLAADGSAVVSAGTVADVAQRAGYGIGFPTVCRR
jgi:hypothetical protein